MRRVFECKFGKKPEMRGQRAGDGEGGGRNRIENDKPSVRARTLGTDETFESSGTLYDRARRPA